MVLFASTTMAARLRRGRFAVLVAAGSLVSHDLVVFARQAFGLTPATGDATPAPAMDMGGAMAIDPTPAGDAGSAVQHMNHQGYWPLVTVAAIVAVALIAAVGIRRIVRLTAALRGQQVQEPAEREAGGRGYFAELDHLWPRLFVAITIVFTLQENLAFAANGQVMNGAGILFCPEHPLAVPVLGLISFFLAAVGGWIRWRTEILQRRLQAMRLARRYPSQAAAHRPDRRWGLVAAAVAHRWIRDRPQAGRAPPARAGA